jgi:hypothetical protein
MRLSRCEKQSMHSCTASKQRRASLASPPSLFSSLSPHTPWRLQSELSVCFKCIVSSISSSPLPYSNLKSSLRVPLHSFHPFLPLLGVRCPPCGESSCTLLVWYHADVCPCRASGRPSHPLLDASRVYSTFCSCRSFSLSVGSISCEIGSLSVSLPVSPKLA